MLKKIFALLVLSAIIPMSLIGAVNAGQGMLTYTNKEYRFSIEYPEDWTVDEGVSGVTFRESVEEDIISVEVGTAFLSKKMTAEEYIEERIKVVRERFSVELNVVKTFSDIINGEPVAVYIITGTSKGIELKLMLACFVSNSTAYTITSSAPSSTYNAAEDNYFNPMLQSFKLLEKGAGIEIWNFIVTPSKVKTGENITF